MKGTTVIFQNENFQINRENKCCVCGVQQELTRHHILPSCYTSHLNEKIKKELKDEHRFYYEWEYCCLCTNHHHEYEVNFANQLHTMIWKKYKVDLTKTSYKQVKSLLPKPGKVVAMKLQTKQDYFELRDLCITFFKEKMQPKFSLL